MTSNSGYEAIPLYLIFLFFVWTHWYQCAVLQENLGDYASQQVVNYLCGKFKLIL